MRRALLLVFCLTALAWVRPILDGGFAFDDREAIENNPVVTGALPARSAWTRDYWHHLGDAGHYRPVATLLLRLDHTLFGLDGRGYHATTVLLHAGAACALALLAIRIGFRGRAAVIGGLLFGLHPSLADGVAWISGRTSPAAALAGLLALLVAAQAPASAKRWPATALRFAALALLLFLAAASKEDGLFFLPVAILLAAKNGRRALVFSTAAAAVALFTYAALRQLALGSFFPSAPHAPLAHLPLVERLGFGGRAFLEALRLAVLPLAHSPSYRFAPGFHAASPPGTLGFLGLALWLALLACSFAFALSKTREGRTRFLCLGAAALTWLPFTGLVPAGEVFAPRFLYLPLLGVALFVATPLSRLPRPALAACCTLAILGAWDTSRTYTGLVPWSRAVLRHVPADPTAWNTLGLGLEEEQRADDARRAFERAVELDPGYGRAWNNLARLALEGGDRAGSLAAFERAVQVGRGNPIAWTNLAGSYLRAARYREAESAYRRTLEISPGLQPAWRGLGRALLALGKPEEARSAWERALELDPDDRRTRALIEDL